MSFEEKSRLVKGIGDGLQNIYRRLEAQYVATSMKIGHANHDVQYGVIFPTGDAFSRISDLKKGQIKKIPIEELERIHVNVTDVSGKDLEAGIMSLARFQENPGRGTMNAQQYHNTQPLADVLQTVLDVREL